MGINASQQCRHKACTMTRIADGMLCIMCTYLCCVLRHKHFAEPAVNSVLAIGGVGGLAVGLAGREILENLFTGLIILSSSPFEVGDEVLFSPPTGSVSLSHRSKTQSHCMSAVPCPHQSLVHPSACIASRDLLPQLVHSQYLNEML